MTHGIIIILALIGAFTGILINVLTEVRKSIETIEAVLVESGLMNEGGIAIFNVNRLAQTVNDLAHPIVTGSDA